MANLETDDLNQYGVLWTVIGADSFGVQRVEAPIEIACRWNLGSNLTDGAVSSHRSVGMAAVDRKVPLEAILWKGRLSEYLAMHDPGDLMMVIGYKAVDDIKGRNTRHLVTLGSWNHRLPPAVQ